MLASQLVIYYFLPNCMEVIDRLHEDAKNNMIENTLQKLRAAGGRTTHSELMRSTRLRKKDFTDCIEALTEAQSIKTTKNKSTGAVTYILVESGTAAKAKVSNKHELSEHFKHIPGFDTFHTFPILHTLHGFTEIEKSSVKNRQNQETITGDIKETPLRGVTPVKFLCEDVKCVKNRQNGQNQTLKFLHANFIDNMANEYQVKHGNVTGENLKNFATMVLIRAGQANIHDLTLNAVMQDIRAYYGISEDPQNAEVVVHPEGSADAIISQLLEGMQ
jgi:hypothetical protein